MMVSAPDPLAGLRPLHRPLPVSWWPPAPGWWLLAGQKVTVPDVAGKSQAEATQALQDAGLKLGAVSEVAAQPPM